MSDDSRPIDTSQRPLHVAVVVMGDLGRSPRMQYHAFSLLQEGHYVSLLGYDGEDLVPDLSSSSTQTQRLRVIRFSTSSPPQSFRKIVIFYYVWRLISLVYNLAGALEVAFRRRAVDCVLVQNPPAMPLIVLSYARCRLQWIHRGISAALVIDWHNLGYSMLRRGSVIAKVAEGYERTVGKYLADGHLCVTAAMKTFLLENVGVAASSEREIRILYDCPPSLFRPLKLAEQHEVLLRLSKMLTANCPRTWYEELNLSCDTILTTKQRNGEIVSRRGRPALVTSSTSWTEDEDFGILLEALISLDERISNEQSTLRVLVVVTGKGPMKAMYEQKISKLKLTNVSVQTIWLEPADYPRLLACADLGISLHTSTSGLDLPMKVLDLFGCRVPVCAYDFECLSELVLDGINGRLFTTSGQLSQQLHDLLTPIVTHKKDSQLRKLADNLRDRTRRHDNWKENALPVIEEAASKRVPANSS